MIIDEEVTARWRYAEVRKLQNFENWASAINILSVCPDVTWLDAL